jgi:hypothetical protein
MAMAARGKYANLRDRREKKCATFTSVIVLRGDVYGSDEVNTQLGPGIEGMFT